MSKIKKRNLTISGILLMLLLSVVLFATMSGTSISANAETMPSLESIIYTDPSAFQFTAINSTECSVKLIDKSQVNVRVPKTATINGTQYTVTEVTSNGFSSNTVLKTVILPNTIRKIGNSGFQNCKYLELVYAPEVKDIGASSFALCPALSDFIFPATVENVGASIFLLNNTKVHARFDSVQSGWASNWNTGNTVQIQNHDFNGLDDEGFLWKHDFIYEEIQQTNPLTRTTSVVSRLAPMQPRSENINHGHGTIEADIEELLPDSINGTYQSLTILPSTKELNIWSLAFNEATVIEGITINREVTYNCGYTSGDSFMVFNAVDTPFITLPTPEKILPSMFVYTTARNINFRTSTGLNYENQGVVRLPETITEIKNNAFDETYNIKHLYIPANVTEIEYQAFNNWNNTQTIYMPFFSESHANNILGTDWKNGCSANIVYAGDLSVISQPTDIINNSTYTMVFEFKIDKNQYTLEQFTSSASYNYWDKNTFANVLDISFVRTDTLQGDYWVRRWEYNISLKSTSNGESRFTFTLNILKDNNIILTATTTEIKVHRFLRTATDFNNFTFGNTAKDLTYDTYLLNDINLGTYNSNINRGIKIINYGKIYGNNYTISYTLNPTSLSNGNSFNLALFEENRGTINNLKINANITVSNLSFPNNVGTVDAAGIAIENMANSQINNCEVTINTSIMAPKIYIGGISVENDGIINNCTVKGNMSSPAIEFTAIGGIATFNWSGEIKDSANQATINSYGNIGGIAVQNHSIITNCKNHGTLTLNYKYFKDGINSNRSIGGIVSFNDESASVTNSTNAGTIKFGQYDDSGYIEAKWFLQPTMGHIAGSNIGTMNSNSWSGGSVITTGLSALSGWNQALYARNAECGYSNQL